MGFVFILHSLPDHKSELKGILSKVSSIPIHEITGEIPIKPNNGYVVLPNYHVTIEGGRLKPHKLRKGSNHHSIDSFMESLAQSQKEYAGGILFSGTGSDGTKGMEAVKAEGGITFAQDGSAGFDQMPQSAIEAGCIDLVLSPSKIAQELANLPKDLPKEVLQHDQDGSIVPVVSSDGGLEKILTLLRNHSGVDFSHYKPSTIERRIARRMVLNKKPSIKEYVNLLKGNTGELDALYGDVLINVTSFFRNPEAFDAIKHKVFPQLIASAEKEPIRIWVVGCSSGQEAYSLAMTFLECLEETNKEARLQIFATDLNETLLNKARSGFYPEAFIEDISPERLRKFFVQEEKGYRINKKLREMCVFAKQDLTGDPPFSRLDLITCRNVLIYLGSDLQKNIIPLFHYALKPQGFLFLGASESTSSFLEIFEPFDKRHKIFSKKAVPSPSSGMHFLRKSSESKQENVHDKHNASLSIELNAQREADRVTLSRYAPPAVLIDKNLQILQFRGNTSAYLQPPVGTAHLHLLKMAKENLVQHLRVLINRAQKDNKVIRKEGIRVTPNGRNCLVTIEVIPLKHLKEPFYLIIFEEVANRLVTAQNHVSKSLPRGQKNLQEKVGELEQELVEAKDFAQAQQEEHESVQEELKASNEEIQSTNEELQSINEELETSKEELESTNEELATVNEELAARNTELNRLNSDLINLQNSMITGVVLLGRDLTIRSFSPLAEKIFNIFSSDIGRPLNRIRHQLNLTDLEQMIAEVIDTVSLREREVQDKDGRWYFLRIRPYMTMDNRIDGAVIVIIDIDDHKRSQQLVLQLQASQETQKRFRYLADHAPVLIWTSDTQKLCTWFNKPWLDFVGRPLEQEIGNGWTENVHPHDLRECLRVFTESFDARQPFRMEYRLKRHDGEYRWFLDNGIPLYTDGEFAGYIGSCIDIHERKQSEEIRRLLSAIVEFSDDAIISKDLNGIIRSWNKAAERIYGYTAEEAIGKPVLMLIPEDLPNEEPSILEHIRKGERVDHYQTIRKRKDGKLINVSLTVSPIKDEKGVIIGASKIARDVTERVKAEQMLIENETRLRKLTMALSNSNSELEQFAYVASHDLKEPLHVVSSFTHLLEKRIDPKLEKDEREYLKFIKQGIQQAQILIKDLLEYSRLGREKEKQETDLSLVLNEVLLNLRVIIENTHAVIKSDPMPKIMANHLGMVRIFQNLLSNALKYRSQKPPEITISVESKENEFVFSIKDNGIGIDPQYSSRIFDMFQRLHSKSEYSGSGIGLAICKRVVENHGGRIWVSSELGQGSTFFFTMPKEASQDRL